MSQNYETVLAQFDRDVEDAVEKAYRDEGYVDDSGEWSEAAMKDAAFQIVLEHCVVDSKSERSKKALTNGELYSHVFPSGPGAGEKAPALDRVAERVLKKLLSDVWGLTQTGRSGFIQKRFESEGMTLVLCRRSVFRNAESRQAVYATDNESLILEDAVDKAIQSLVRRASSLRRDLNMIIERHPELQGAIAAQLGLEVGRIDSELEISSGEKAGKRRKRLVASTEA